MHFFFEDLAGFSAAALLALLLIVAPGFGLVRIAARRCALPTSGWRGACWALVLGGAILPAIDALLLRWFGMAGVLALHSGLAAAGARPLVDAAKAVPARWWLAPLAAFAIVGWANLDFDWNHRLYQSALILDGVKHAAVVGSLASHGLPLHDPFFVRPQIAGYYDYFYLAPALIHWLGGAWIDSRMAFAAATLATLLTFPALLMLVGEAAALIPAGARRRFFRIGLLLMLVSGFDLLAGLWIWSRTGQLIAQLDWWSEEVRWALTSVLWVPHHVAAVIAVYAGALLVAGGGQAALRWRVPLAGAAFATAFGASLWIALAAAPILGLWWLWELRQSGRGSGWALPASAATAFLLSVPQILDIVAGRSVAGPPLTWYMRPLGPVRTLPGSVGEWLVHLTITPGGYFIEFGLFALGTLAFLTRGRSAQSRATPIGRFLIVGAPVALLACTFFRSAVLYNDFGWRAMWFAQLPAMLWTAAVVVEAPRRWLSRPAWALGLALGLAALAWDLLGMRAIRPYAPLGFVNQAPEVDYEARAAYRWIDRNLPSGALVQHNPVKDGRALDFGLYSDREVAIADGEAQLFGADRRAVEARGALLRPVFERPMAPAELRARAAAGLSGLILTSADPLWARSGGVPSGWTCRYRSPNLCVMILGEPRR